MKNRVPNLFSFRYWLRIFGGLLLTVFSGFYFFEVFAKTEIAENSAIQNLTLGKLAYDALTGTFGGPQVRIVTANADGSGQTPIAGGDFSAFHPSWSPDGTKIVYSFSAVDIYVMNSDGGNRINLTNSQELGERHPSWSVTNKIAYERTSRVWVMNSDGTNQMQFPGITQATSLTPDWSPNGSKLAFVSGGDIWTINADGTDEQRITTSGVDEKDPSWSPDGTKIIFAKAGTGIVTVNPDGSNEAILTNNANDIEPDWSSDGTAIAFYRATTFGGRTDGGIYVMSANGANQVRIIADTPGTASNVRTNSNPAWQPVAAPRPAQFDFDGDFRSDISVFRPSNGAWYLLRSTAGLWIPQWGISTDVIVPADYDGDLKTDVAVWRPSDGNFYILNSFDDTVRVENFGLNGDIPTGGDWDGDGKADLAVYRGGANGTFYYRGSMENPNGNITFIPWGISGDKPVVGDFDGDGRTDAAIYRNGTWWIRQSSNGQTTAINFGLANDRAVPADYDGDGKTDVAVYRDGVWYLLRSAQGFTAFQFGISTDTPAPADYDGDGRADAAIYRNGVWWILKSQSGAAEAISFGLGGDAPVPSAFVR